MERKPVTSDDIAVLAKTTRLNLPENRNQLQADTMNSIFQMLDSLDDDALGETSPAFFTYRAKWEGGK